MQQKEKSRAPMNRTLVVSEEERASFKPCYKISLKQSQ